MLAQLPYVDCILIPPDPNTSPHERVVLRQGSARIMMIIQFVDAFVDCLLHLPTEAAN